MSHHNKSPQEADITNTQSTIEELVRPLLACLQAKYPTGNHEVYQVHFIDRFRDDYQHEGRTLLELPDDLKEHEQALAAVVTILQATGSEPVWACGERYDGECPLQGPLRFSFLKRAAWADSFWAWSHFVQIDDGGAVLDPEKAAQQVAGLVDLVSDESNLIPIGPEERALF